MDATRVALSLTKISNRNSSRLHHPPNLNIVYKGELLGTNEETVLCHNTHAQHTLKTLCVRDEISLSSKTTPTPSFDLLPAFHLNLSSSSSAYARTSTTVIRLHSHSSRCQLACNLLDKRCQKTGVSMSNSWMLLITSGFNKLRRWIEDTNCLDGKLKIGNFSNDASRDLD